MGDLDGITMTATSGLGHHPGDRLNDGPGHIAAELGNWLGLARLLPEQFLGDGPVREGGLPVRQK
jgi:hypothetical protein